MKLDNLELHSLFHEKGVSQLFHANTVSTSISFIQQNGLLSRGGIEAKKLYQTTQKSDAIDKCFNIWNDVFFDTIDLHNHFPRQNFYGPVSFQFSIDFLLKEDIEIWVTKNNPIYWNTSMEDEEKYFQCVKELEKDWHLYECQKKMVIVKDRLEPILFNYLDRIIIDDPKVIIEEKSLLQESLFGLEAEVTDNFALRNKIEVRECSNCFCEKNYLNKTKSELKKLFSPMVLS